MKEKAAKPCFLTEFAQQIYFRVVLQLTTIFCAANCKRYFVMVGNSDGLFTRRTAEYIPACLFVKALCN